MSFKSNRHSPCNCLHGQVYLHSPAIRESTQKLSLRVNLRAILDHCPEDANNQSIADALSNNYTCRDEVKYAIASYNEVVKRQVEMSQMESAQNEVAQATDEQAVQSADVPHMRTAQTQTAQSTDEQVAWSLDHIADYVSLPTCRSPPTQYATPLRSAPILSSQGVMYALNKRRRTTRGEEERSVEPLKLL